MWCPLQRAVHHPREEGPIRIGVEASGFVSEYMISRATFSSYFFKEKNVVGDRRV
jgi:Citrate lyase ligase C-terminal domain